MRKQTRKQDSQYLKNILKHIEIDFIHGDTVYAKITKLPKEIGNYKTTFKVGDIIKLRIPSIDTFEEHVPGQEVDPVEKAYALRDHAFAESLIPVGTKVRMVSPN